MDNCQSAIAVLGDRMTKIHPVAAQLLNDITAYCDRFKVDRTTFGRNATGDGHFIPRVEAGKLPTIPTIDRVYGYMHQTTKAVRSAKLTYVQIVNGDKFPAQ
jgi:hypothetical protein